MKTIKELIDWLVGRMNKDKIVEYLARMLGIIILGVIVAVILGMCSCTRTVYV